MTFFAWLRALLRGVVVRWRGVEVQLDQKPGAYPAGQSPLDSTPAKVTFPKVGPPR